MESFNDNSVISVFQDWSTSGDLLPNYPRFPFKQKPHEAKSRSADFQNGKIPAGRDEGSPAWTVQAAKRVFPPVRLLDVEPVENQR